MHICLLDIDGTLILTGGAGQTAIVRTLAEDFGIAKVDANVAFAGRSDRAIAMDLFRSHGIAETAENWARFSAGYLARLQAALESHQGFVLPGVDGFLSALVARGDVALGLLTGNVREGARRKLIYYGLWHHFLFGGFGVHKFMLGYTTEGLIQIAITVITCGMGGIIGLIEGIIYLTKSDQEFVDTYIRNKKGWF